MKYTFTFPYFWAIFKFKNNLRLKKELSIAIANSLVTRVLSVGFSKIFNVKSKRKSPHLHRCGECSSTETKCEWFFIQGVDKW